MTDIEGFINEWGDYLGNKDEGVLHRMNMEADLKELIQKEVHQALWLGSEGMPVTEEFLEKIQSKACADPPIITLAKNVRLLLDIIKWQQARIALMATDNGYKDGYEVGYKKGFDEGAKDNGKSSFLGAIKAMAKILPELPQ